MTALPTSLSNLIYGVITAHGTVRKHPETPRCMDWTKRCKCSGHRHPLLSAIERPVPPGYSSGFKLVKVKRIETGETTTTGGVQLAIDVRAAARRALL
jgi:hypothetical protein